MNMKIEDYEYINSIDLDWLVHVFAILLMLLPYIITLILIQNYENHEYELIIFRQIWNYGV